MLAALAGGGGLRLFIYSSGSTEAQRLIFGHSTEGDLTGLLSGYFDTRVGAKREAASYSAISESIGATPGAVLFLSDVEAELDAAAAAGLATCQVVRPADGTVASTRHAVAATFLEAEGPFRTGVTLGRSQGEGSALRSRQRRSL
ncbi:MAG: acireductone synthase [Acetobacteraceae bacterium]